MSLKKEKTEAYLAYQRYIKSKEFQVVKEQCFERDKHACVCCGWSEEEYDPNKKSNKRSLSCHHRTYKHLYDELNHMEDVVTLCNICHLRIHSAPSNFSRFKKPE